VPPIIGDLGGLRLFSWVSHPTMAVSVPVYGWLASKRGKRVFFVVAGIFGTTLCGFSSNIPALTLFRAVQGLGSGALHPITSTIVGDTRLGGRGCRATFRVPSGFGRSSARCHCRALRRHLCKTPRRPFGIAVGTQHRKPPAHNPPITIAGLSPTTDARGRGPSRLPSRAGAFGAKTKTSRRPRQD
jgi:hypothetical protein